jgi:fructose-specific phosphotransferase system IIA component
MIRKELITVNADFTNRLEAIKKMTQMAKAADVIADEEVFYQAVLDREDETVTSIGYEVAIPHGKTNTVKEAFLVFMKTKETFIWDERNSEKVNTIFLMGIPEEKGANEHLRVLSQISRNLMNEEFREKLKHCKDNEDTYALLSVIK